MVKAPHALLVELRDVFVENFKLGELNEFAFDLGVDPGNFETSTLNGRARELPEYLNRRGEIWKLAIIGPKRRKEIDWVGILGKHGISSPGASDGTVPTEQEGTLKPLDLQKLVPILSSYSGFQTPASRQSLLDINGLGRTVNVNLAIGGARDVALELLLALNRRGRLAEGDTAIGRLCAHLAADDTLPSSDRDVVIKLMTHYGLF